MTWNWQQKEWPEFKYDVTYLAQFEEQFLHQSGVIFGAYKHLKDEDQTALKVSVASDEALKTSEIEGEYLNRDSLQCSIRKNFGLSTDSINIPPAERGIAELTVDVYLSFGEPLTHETLFKWHGMLTQGRTDLKDVARYRTHSEPMQVVSGPIYEPKVYFEAPPSSEMMDQMAQFIGWFNKTATFGMKPIPNLIRAGVAHLYFVSIHPFEDGNGRIARALVNKVLSQSLGYPALIALSQTIQAKRKDYYKMLEHSNQSLEINEWLRYFAQVILRAQESAKDMIYFLIEKTKLYDRVKGVLNPRQEKVLSRVFQEGLNGFKGGLSAENYIKLTKTSRATATRDLQDLVDKNVFVSSGIRKGTRYHLNVARN